MNNTIKLSELLEHGVIGLEVWAEGCQERGMDAAERMHLDEQKALRAIAPALVEYVAASHYFLSMDADPDYHDRVQRYKNAWVAVHDAMKAAGVTCD